MSLGSWRFSHTPYRSTPHQQVSLQPHDYAPIPWLSEPSSTVISRQPSKSPREYVTAFPKEKCSQENSNGTTSAELQGINPRAPLRSSGNQGSSCLWGGDVHLPPLCKQGSEDHPPIPPVGPAELRELVHLPPPGWVYSSGDSAAFTGDTHLVPSSAPRV